MTIHLVGSGPGADGLDEVWDSFVAQAKRRAGSGDEPAPIALCVLALPEDAGEDPADWAGGYTDPIRARWPEARFELVVLRPSQAFISSIVSPTQPETSSPQTGNTDEAPAPAAEGDEQTPTHEQTPSHEQADPGDGSVVENFPTDLTAISGIIVGGGWTPGYLHCLIPHRDQLARAVRRDLPYLGFSAGASIASRHALIGGSHADGIQVQQIVSAEDLPELTVTDGLALISTLVQVHTDAWSNEGAVISVLERNLAGHGVSIDEGTALVVDPVNGRTQRLGRGRLRWFSKEQHGVLVRTEEPAAPRPAPDMAR